MSTTNIFQSNAKKVGRNKRTNEFMKIIIIKENIFTLFVTVCDINKNLIQNTAFVGGPCMNNNIKGLL